MTLSDRAAKAAGNWQRFPNFAWFGAGEHEDADKLAILYTSNRDSGLLDQSNEAAMRKALEPYTEGDNPDVWTEQHGHWLVGHVTGFVIRVYDAEGNITPAFEVWHELQERLAVYPALDEDDWSGRTWRATDENFRQELVRWMRNNDREDGEVWQELAIEALWENGHATESRDDQGGWPSEDDLVAAADHADLELPQALLRQDIERQRQAGQLDLLGTA